MQRTDIDTSRIIVFGRSLGGAVGAVLARNNPEKVFFYKKKLFLIRFNIGVFIQYFKKNQTSGCNIVSIFPAQR